MAQHQPHHQPLSSDATPRMTFDEAVGRVFEFLAKSGNGLVLKRYLVVRSHRWAFQSSVHIALVINLDTYTEVVMWDARLTTLIPDDWKEILP